MWIEKVGARDLICAVNERASTDTRIRRTLRN